MKKDVITNIAGATALAACAALVLSGALLPACGTFKNVARTITDAGMVLCQIYAAEPIDDGDTPAELAGLTPEQFCAIAENLQPFIDEALAAKQAAGRQLSRDAR